MLLVLLGIAIGLAIAVGILWIIYAKAIAAFTDIVLSAFRWK